MARAAGSNTGKGNYPAGRAPGNKEQVIAGLKGVTPARFPNRNLSTTQYKRGLKKEESDA